LEAKKKEIVIQYADVSGGCNSIEYPTLFQPNQVHDSSIGYILRKSGITKYPGAQGLSAATTFDDYLRAMFLHRQFAGTESLYALSDGNLSLVDTTDGSLTTKYAMGGPTSKGVATDAYGKKWVCNGTSTVKIEGTTAYQVGLTAPTGATAAASAGAGLSDGEYGVYVSYARKVSGVNKLYSQGQLIASVTLGGGNNQITVTMANSGDAQVNNKVVWIKSPAEVVHYFFHETGDNTTTSIVISGTTAKLTSTIYEFNAADNGNPPAITYIFAFAGRLWGIKDNIIYYSDMGEFSEYDLEVWRAASYRITQYKLTGIFSVGQNLYFNTDNGILLLQNGDVNQMLYLIETRWHFQFIETVSAWNNGVIGVTNQGVRIFDGMQFSQYDLAYPIREKLERIYSESANFSPCGFVYRRENRDEYHLMWQDNTFTSTVNNEHAILNLSSIIWQDVNAYQLAWEFQPISGNFAAISSDNTIYIGQTHETASKIYKENNSTAYNNNCYNAEGELLAVDTALETSLRTREFLYDTSAVMWLRKFYVYAQNDFPFTIQIFSGEDIDQYTTEITIPASGEQSARYDAAIYDAARYPIDGAETTRKKLPTDFKARSIYVIIKQSADDIRFKLMQLNIFATVETGNYL
jgi:hypothetical protein